MPPYLDSDSGKAARSTRSRRLALGLTLVGFGAVLVTVAGVHRCSWFAGTQVTRSDPAAVGVRLTIDTAASAHPISPYIYGINDAKFGAEAKGLTLSRSGGNRLTAYNWETNASNAGSDYRFQNDALVSSSTVSGEPIKRAVQSAANAGASIIVTVPMAGWVSADTRGLCEAHPANPSVIARRFFPMLARKGSPFEYPPNKSDGKVYADEFVWWLEAQFPGAQTDPARRIFYMLDNEPDLWSHTHSEIHPDPVTYAELVQRTKTFASAIKDVAPKALVFAPASYGWNGYVNLQNAPDADKRDFLDFYLESMKAAEASAGKRLLDVLDLHWYPEAQGGGKRITEGGTEADRVAARLEAPRSLWDASYVEASWIAKYGTHGPIRLIPRLLEKISVHYPGTKLSISEYNYGAGGDVSGGIAQADVLGIFGREGLFAATLWPLSVNNAFLFGAFAMYRNFDGRGGKFGDRSVSASTSAIDESSVYASTVRGSSNVTAVVLNKHTTALAADIVIKHDGALNAADVYTLTAESSTPVQRAGLTKIAANAFRYRMPARSVSTLVFHP